MVNVVLWWCININQIIYPTNDVLCVDVKLAQSCLLHLFGIYIPGPSDVRFRSLQGAGRHDHFGTLGAVLDSTSDGLNFVCGDFNGRFAGHARYCLSTRCIC